MWPQMPGTRPLAADLERQPLLRSQQNNEPGDASAEDRPAQPNSTQPNSPGFATPRIPLRTLSSVLLVLAKVLAVMWTLYLVISWAAWALNPTPPSSEQRARDAAWVSGSPYWADRQACRWLSLCGVHHLRWDPPALEGGDVVVEVNSTERAGASFRRRRAKAVVSQGGGGAKQIPDYVLRHAPLVHLHSGESFWPASPAEHVKHMRPLNYTVPSGGAAEYDEDGSSRTLLNLTDLDPLNAIHGSAAVYLTSTDDVETRPSWLSSRDAMPSSSQNDESHGRSTAPAVLVLVEKETADGGEPVVLDVFWFFFYSYNLGQTVLGVRFGNHVGDWEHCMVRFVRGEPTAMFLSEHAGGQAYAWRALEKAAAAGVEGSKDGGGGDRPVIYSAVGSHAMYATPGDHPYVLPFGMLKDLTDKGPLWDPAKNAWAYWHEQPSGDDVSGNDGDAARGVFKPAAPTGGGDGAPAAGWLGFRGRWGDQLYSLGDQRQWRLFNQYHYVTGPTGPADKQLWRSKMCPQSKCEILNSLEAGRKRTWYT